MVVDVHHDKCNKSPKDIGEYIEDIFKIWEEESLPPKIHLSSPKKGKGMRHHADFIEVDDFIQFLYKAKKVDSDFDVMIEAKQKNLALHKLMKDLRGVDGIEIVNGGEIIF